VSIDGTNAKDLDNLVPGKWKPIHELKLSDVCAYSDRFAIVRTEPTEATPTNPVLQNQHWWQLKKTQTPPQLPSAKSRVKGLPVSQHSRSGIRHFKQNTRCSKAHDQRLQPHHPVSTTPVETESASNTFSSSQTSGPATFRERNQRRFINHHSRPKASTNRHPVSNCQLLSRSGPNQILCWSDENHTIVCPKSDPRRFGNPKAVRRSFKTESLYEPPPSVKLPPSSRS
jgi:hypothetical protein